MEIEHAKVLCNHVMLNHDNGGALHIVLADENVDNEDILWCLRNSIQEIAVNETYQLYTRCAVALLDLEIEDRLAIVREL